ncbi:MAG: HD domain-containing protein [Bdellovibrionota bacterium]
MQTPAQPTPIRDLKEKDTLHQAFLVREKTVALGKNGRPFMSVVFSDKTAQIDGRLWDNVESVTRDFDTGDVVMVKGQIQIFQGRKQLVIHKIEKMDPATYKREDFVPEQVDAQHVYLELLEIVRTMQHAPLKQLVLDTIEDPELKPMLLRAPAAKSIHHAWNGGLLEHVVSICRIMDFFANHYGDLNRDLLIFGAIYHDIGKLWELSYADQLGYTSRGRLIGHMEMGCELVDKKASKILGFSQELRDACKHIILSHHGKLEYGSPALPQFPEAMLVAMVDDLDSKMSTIRTFINLERSSGAEWSRYNELFSRYFLLENMKTKFP